jgi:IS4 transposase
MTEQRDRTAAEELERLRRTRQTRVDRMLNKEMLSQAPGNAAYWVAVVIGSFAVNLLLLILIAR